VSSQSSIDRPAIHQQGGGPWSVVGSCAPILSLPGLRSDQAIAQLLHLGCSEPARRLQRIEQHA